MHQKGTAQLRVERYFYRQNPAYPRWGQAYQPAIQAVREEAPGRSRPTIITAANKLRRPLHVLSLAERAALLLALYNPKVIDVHEQRVLDPAPSPHPLHGHPTHGIGQHHRSLPGTWAIAEQLGYRQHHPVLTVVDDQGNRGKAPHPLVGDLLLYLQSADAAYCVNWNIKSCAREFTHKARSDLTKNPDRANERVAARNAIERACYAAADIPTHEIAGEALPRTLIATLADGLAAQARPALPASVQEQIITCVRDAIGTPRTPLDMLSQFSLQYGLNHQQFRDAVLRAIWHRELRVDLFERIYFDQPLKPEKTDVLEYFADWFAGGST